jgi:hypothetical protein
MREWEMESLNLSAPVLVSAEIGFNIPGMQSVTVQNNASFRHYPASLFACMHLGFLLFVFFLTSCSSRDSTPVETVNAFLRAIKRQDCETAWNFFSAETQRLIREESARMIGTEPYYADVFSPKNLYCLPTAPNHYLACVPGSAKLALIQGEEATVLVERRKATGFRLPGFFAKDYETEQVKMRLTWEKGGWKIDHGPEASSGAPSKNKTPEALKEELQRRLEDGRSSGPPDQ